MKNKTCLLASTVLVISLHTLAASQVGHTEIAKWQNGKSGAVSLTNLMLSGKHSFARNRRPAGGSQTPLCGRAGVRVDRICEFFPVRRPKPVFRPLDELRRAHSASSGRVTRERTARMWALAPGRF
jgi:hypothetical protein